LVTLLKSTYLVEGGGRIIKLLVGVWCQLRGGK
jgi:hypothetical protein